MDTSSVSSILHDSGMEEGELLSSEGSEGGGSPLLVDDDVIRSSAVAGMGKN